MMIHIPSALRSSTAQQSEAQVEGATLAAAVAGLERHFPGIRFRIITEQDTIRPHIRIFVNE
jgi:molybdopterin synthase sulfur carrier subunit